MQPGSTPSQEPNAGKLVKLLWRTSEGVDTAEVSLAANNNQAGLAIWAQPGKHWIEATQLVQEYRTITVLVPDPAAPDDPTKFKTQELKLYDPATIERFEATFEITGKAPEPPDGPDGPDEPDDKLPDGQFKLAQWAYDNAAAKVPGSARGVARAIADCFEANAANINPADPNLTGFSTVEELLEATIDCNRDAAGSKKDDWLPWFEALDEQLSTMAEGGKLNTLSDHKTAWQEIAAGLTAFAK